MQANKQLVVIIWP